MPSEHKIESRTEAATRRAREVKHAISKEIPQQSSDVKFAFARQDAICALIGRRQTKGEQTE